MNIQLKNKKHELIQGLQALLMMLQHAMMDTLFVAFFKVQDLTMIQCRRNQLREQIIMEISQGQEDEIPLLQPQGNMQLHLPLTGVQLIHNLSSPSLQTPNWNIAHDPLQPLLIIRQRQRELLLHCTNCQPHIHQQNLHLRHVQGWRTTDCQQTQTRAQW